MLQPLINNIRETYRITHDILRDLQLGDNYFLPLFNVEAGELSNRDIHKSSDDTLPRIIAFGDIHGDLQALVGILYAAELIDIHGNWIEERSTYVVQTGDLFDNYRPTIQNSCLKDPENLFDEFIILNYLTHLHRQAQRKESKSCIVLCIGNHELINLSGDKKRMTDYVIEIPALTLTIDARIALFRRGGVFANKLSSIFRVIAKIDKNLFMHGGIHEGNIESLADIPTYNTNLHAWMNTATIELSPKIYSGDKTYSSITWYREITTTNETMYIRFLTKLDADHKLKVIVGHTPYSDTEPPQIVTRARGRIILLDTAMSRCWNDKKGKSCDLSNKLYNISFIVMDEDRITHKDKRALTAHSKKGGRIRSRNNRNNKKRNRITKYMLKHNVSNVGTILN
jgi:hypothetical protein